MKYFIRIIFLLVLQSVCFTTIAQKQTKALQCATMNRLEKLFERNPQLKTRFEQQRDEFNKAVEEDSYRISRQTQTIYYIPVVFHIVTTNPTAINDEQIQDQLEVLNKDFAGTNADSVNIPSYFKSLFGKSSIQFCLAQRNPDGESASGIERITTTKTSFSYLNDEMKYSSSGGADSWAPEKYFNVWICALSDDILGYATFPEDGLENAQGVVVDYRSLPGGSYTGYNTGKTLSHETGHYFNLYHIWGDDDGACSGTDYVSDTPNQADASSGCASGVKQIIVLHQVMVLCIGITWTTVLINVSLCLQPCR